MASQPLSSTAQRRASARAGEIFVNPRILVLQQFLDRADLDLLVHQNGDAVGGGAQRVDVMRDHEHGKPEALLQIADKLIELRRGNRIETRRRLIEKKQFRIERKRAREAGALLHAARKLGWKFARRVFGQ